MGRETPAACGLGTEWTEDRGYVLCLHHVLQRLLRYSPSSSRPCPCLRATNPHATRERRRGERERLTSPRSPRPRLALPPPWAGRKRVRGWSTRSCQSRPRRLRSRRREATRTRGALCPSPAASSIGPRRVWLSPPLAKLPQCCWVVLSRDLELADLGAAEPDSMMNFFGEERLRSTVTGI